LARLTRTTLASRRRAKMIYNSKRIVMQFEMIHSALQRNVQRTEILERVAAARVTLIHLMADLLQEEMFDLPPEVLAKPREEVVESMMQVLHRYLR
jgi:DNA-binding FrmR family transcriptional regulator